MVETAGILYTPDARLVLDGASAYAAGTQYPTPLPWHLLRALDRETPAELDDAMGAVRVTTLLDSPPPRPLSFTVGHAHAMFEQTLQRARARASDRGVPAIEPQDLLIAALWDDLVEDELRKLGWDPDLVRERVDDILAGALDEAPAASKRAAQGSQVSGSPEPSARPGQRVEGVPTHADRPAEVDLLKRRHLAQVVAERLRRIRGENTDVPEPRGRRDRLRRRFRRDDGMAARAQTPREEGAFLVHLHAPWGAGKTTLLNLLREELNEPTDLDLERWVVIDFSAWRHQRVPPPWWWLLSAMRTDGLRSLWKASKPAALRFWIRDLLWRIWNARFAWLPLAIGGGLLAVAFAIDPAELRGKSLTDAQVTIGALAGILGFAVTVWGLIRGISGWLLVGSAPVGSKVLQRVHDPMHMIGRRFRFLVHLFGRPVAVFIDDLDRCDPDYVVELLEGIQTLFMDEPVTYVVAADRHWVCDSYAKVYEGFEESVGQPGRPLGYLFLEKTFQLSIELPPMSRDAGEGLWKSLVSTASPPRPPPLLFEQHKKMDPLPADTRVEFKGRFGRAAQRARVQAARHAFADLDTEEKILGELEQPPSGLADLWRQAALQRLGAASLQRGLEHLLLSYYPLIENNPRGMKRLVNAYGLERARHVRDGVVLDDDERCKLVLWTIVKLRWPRLAERVANDPDLVDTILGNEDPSELDDETRLLRRRDVRDVFRGEHEASGLDLGVDLTKDDVSRFATGERDKPPAAIGA